MKFYRAILELKNCQRDYKFRSKTKKGHLLTQKIGPYLWIFKLRISRPVTGRQKEMTLDLTTCKPGLPVGE